GLLHVALQLDPERAVIPYGSGSAVDLRGLKDVPSPLGEGYELLHDIVVSHARSATCVWGRSARLSSERDDSGQAGERQTREGVVGGRGVPCAARLFRLPPHRPHRPGMHVQPARPLPDAGAVIGATALLMLPQVDHLVAQGG